MAISVLPCLSIPRDELVQVEQYAGQVGPRCGFVLVRVSLIFEVLLESGDLGLGTGSAEAEFPRGSQLVLIGRSVLLPHSHGE